MLSSPEIQAGFISLPTGIVTHYIPLRDPLFECCTFCQAIVFRTDIFYTVCLQTVWKKSSGPLPSLMRMGRWCVYVGEKYSAMVWVNNQYWFCWRVGFLSIVCRWATIPGPVLPATSRYFWEPLSITSLQHINGTLQYVIGVMSSKGF